MFIDRPIRAILNLFGHTKDGDARIHFHSQNLNEDKNGKPKGLPWTGRCWLATPRTQLLQLEWVLGRWQFAMSAQADGEDGGLQLHFAVPFFSVYVTLPIVTKKFGYSNKVIFNIYTHEWALWWKFGGDKHSWHSKTPKWKDGCFHLDDFIFGKVKHWNEILETKEILIPMPEGNYQANATKEKGTWKRPRWFAREMVGIKVDIPTGIPHQGKGENSWDCGEDSLHGYYSEGESYREASDKGTQIVLNSRKKYDGNRMAKYPDPATRLPPQTPSPTQGEASA